MAALAAAVEARVEAVLEEVMSEEVVKSEEVVEMAALDVSPPASGVPAEVAGELSCRAFQLEPCFQAEEKERKRRLVLVKEPGHCYWRKEGRWNQGWRLMSTCLEVAKQDPSGMESENQVRWKTAS